MSEADNPFYLKIVKFQIQLIDHMDHNYVKPGTEIHKDTLNLFEIIQDEISFYNLKQQNTFQLTQFYKVNFF